MPVVIVAPGQGSQSPGFLTPWLEDPTSASLAERLGTAAGVDLIEHGTRSDADTIRDTAVAQPLIVGASLIAADALVRLRGGAGFAGVAGHSVGEFAAAAIAGVLSPDEAMRLVGVRARAMAEAAAQTPTGMSAVLGGEPDSLTARLDELGLFPANFNGAGQLVVGGELAALNALRDSPPPGGRVVPLQVAGAFHTRYMSSAVEQLGAATAQLSPADPRIALWTNRDGRLVSDGAEFLELLVGQVASPVRWDLVMESFAAAGITGLIELAPAGALVGLAKRGLKGVPTVAIKTPEDLSAAVELLEASA